MKLKFVFIVAFLLAGSIAFAQEGSELNTAIRRLTEEKDPEAAVSKMNKIVTDFKLDKNKDAETLDLLYGTVAVNYAMNENYPQFEKYIGLIQNKFNQTSFLNM